MPHVLFHILFSMALLLLLSVPDKEDSSVWIAINKLSPLYSCLYQNDATSLSFGPNLLTGNFNIVSASCLLNNLLTSFTFQLLLPLIISSDTHLILQSVGLRVCGLKEGLESNHGDSQTLIDFSSHTWYRIPYLNTFIAPIQLFQSQDEFSEARA